MAAGYPNSALRASHATAPTKDVKRATVRKSVSIASMFKRQQHPKKSANPLGKGLNIHKTANTSSVKKPHRAASRSSTISPVKGGWGVHKRRSDMHPLAVAFKDTAKDYRTHLYKTTAAKLDNTLNMLVTNLHSYNLTDASPDPNTTEPKPVPAKPTITAKYERMTQQLFQPIGDYTITTLCKKENGEEKKRQTTLLEQLLDFENKYLTTLAEIKKLEAHWETVVGEIWKLGVASLGKEAMSSLLLVQPKPSPPAPTAKAQASLFVPERGDPLASIAKDTKKHVKFEDPPPELPKFLSTPSIYKEHPIPAAPAVSKEQIAELEHGVASLGDEQRDEYQKAHVQQQKWWDRKAAQIATALNKE